MVSSLWEFWEFGEFFGIWNIPNKSGPWLVQFGNFWHFREFCEFPFFLAYIHSYTGGYVDEACEFPSFLSCRLGWMCLKASKKVSPWGGVQYMYIYIYFTIKSLAKRQ